MKKTFTLLSFVVSLIVLLLPGYGNAQCPGGYTQAELNWDHIDFLPSNNARYTSFYPSAAFPYTQNFTIGTRTVNFTMAPSNTLTLNGENGTNTAHAGSLATAGDDIQFTTTATSNNTITVTFDVDVANVMFSLFDIDNNQRVNITATNAVAAAQAITIANASGTSGINITGSGSTSANATGPNTGYTNTDNRGTVNVTIAGPVKRIIITLNNSAGDIWLSDIDACVTGSFPNNYQQISRPFTGQPQYVLTVVNNNIYYVDPTNGNGYFLFNEPGHNRLNSMAYDPYKRVVYYTYSLTGGNNPVTDKTLKKYDVDSKTISVVIPNVNTFGIPTYESGVESGAATFYNGSLYLGVEGYTGTDNDATPYAAGRKSTIWKIDFDAAGNPIAPAAQVWGVTSDDGVNAQNIHDWSDFGITNGELIDFDGSQSGNIDYYHFNLMTGVRTRYAPVGPIPRQVSIGWDEKLYNVDVSISQYNGTNGVGTAFNITAPIGPVIPVGSTNVASWGDAAGPYRPFLDFGDAPATYDPVPLSPACHDTLTPNAAGKRTKMRLGPNEDLEWLKKGFTTIEDNFEDGLAFVPIFSPSTGTYQAEVTVFNNTGTNATLCGWLDFNGNGLFDAAEGSGIINVPSLATTQSFWLSWPAATSSLVSGTFTYLRLRITSASFNMTKNNSTGYYSTGEVEDYKVIVDDTPLAMNLLSFNASLTEQSTVKLNWTASEDINTVGYTIQRSINGMDWEDVQSVSAAHAAGIRTYEAFDNNPHKGVSQYRVKMNGVSGQYKYSEIRIIKTNMPDWLVIYPNPATDYTMLMITADLQGEIAHITISDAKGTRIAEHTETLVTGTNAMKLPLEATWLPGVYIVQVNSGGRVITKKLIIRK
ncbi:MAG: T9SS type A sorting domain-containing protein [Chitinophagaceae bacterium]